MQAAERVAPGPRQNRFDVIRPTEPSRLPRLNQASLTASRKKTYHAQARSRPHECRFQLKGFFETRSSFFQTLPAAPSVQVAIGMHGTEAYVSLRQIRIQLHGAIEVHKGDVRRFFASLLKGVGTLHVEIIGIDTPGLGHGEYRFFLARQTFFQARGRAHGNLLLHLEDVLVRRFELLRPGQKSTLGVDQRQASENPIAGKMERSHEHGIHIQLSRNRLRSRAAVSVTTGRFPWRHPQACLDQSGSDGLADAFRQVVAFERVVADILQWQDRHRQRLSGNNASVSQPTRASKATIAAAASARFPFFPRDGYVGGTAAFRCSTRARSVRTS